MKKIFLLILTVSAALFSCKKETQLDEDLSGIKSYLKSHGITAEKKSNVYCEILKKGTGEQCQAGDTVAVKYKMSIMSKPDSIISCDTLKALTYFLPSVVPNVTDNNDYSTSGFQIALTTMNEGGISRFYVPSSYAFGSEEVGGETYTNIIYWIELCEIKRYGKKH